MQGYTLTWQATIGHILKQLADWSTGSVHVMQGLSLVFTMGFACDQGLISTCMQRRSSLVVTTLVIIRTFLTLSQH